MQRSIKALISLVISPLIVLFILLFVDAPVNLRLPTHILPQLYNITIRTFMEKQDGILQYKFHGDVHIQIKTLIKTKLLILHSKELNYTLLNYWTLEYPYFKQRLKKLRYDYETERLIFELKDALHPKKIYNLHFQYMGQVNKESFGVFRNEYQDAYNKTRWIIGTLSEPAEARRIFPCFDEPKFKANFILSIVRPSHMKSYSNTKRICSYVMGNFTLDVFAKTPKMSTYTFAFLITSYEKRTDKAYSVLAKPEDYALTSFNFEIGRSILITLGNYLNLSYYDMGIDKLHYVALMKLNFQAMENWGLVLSSQNLVLYDENSRDLSHKDEIVKLAAHELSHMWFGNLVTCEWWSYIWLHEGFASYFMYFGPAMLNNGNDSEKWNSLFILSVMQPCLYQHATPLNIYKNEVTRRTYFNIQIYNKGATFIRMVKSTIGERNFQKSLQEYLQTFKYKNVVPDDLFTIWQKYCPMEFINDFLEFCYTYTEQAGYPLITINVANTGQIEIHQQLFQQKFGMNLKNSPIFSVPISYTTDLETDFFHTMPAFYLTKRNVIIELPPTKTPIKWLIANVQATGLYRVHYNKENWQRIGNALQADNFSGIPTLNRAQIVNDIQHLYCAGVIDMQLILNVLNYLRNENKFVVWKTALNGFHKMMKHLVHEFGDLRYYMQNITSDIYVHLGFLDKPNDEPFTLSNREQIIPLACKSGNEHCLATTAYYLQHTKELYKLKENQRFLVYCTAIRGGNETVYENFYKSSNDLIDVKDKELIIRALGCTRLSNLIEKHFWNIINHVEQKHRYEALKTLYTENISNAFQIYKLITKKFDKISSKFGGKVKAAEILKNISMYFTKNSQKQDLADFIKKNIIKNNPTVANILKKAYMVLEVSLRCLN